MNQLALNLGPRSRRRDPETSKDAANAVESWSLERKILECFGFWAGLTDDELADLLDGHHPPTVKTARSRLSKAGVLVDSGTTRLSDRGRAMTVWVWPVGPTPEQRRGET